MNPYPYASLPDLTGGACLEPAVDRTLFFPEGLGSKQQEKAALKICGACPKSIRTRCLVDALEYEERLGATHGTVGGKTEAQRAAMLNRKRRRIA